MYSVRVRAREVTFIGNRDRVLRTAKRREYTSCQFVANCFIIAFLRYVVLFFPSSLPVLNTYQSAAPRESNSRLTPAN